MIPPAAMLWPGQRLGSLLLCFDLAFRRGDDEVITVESPRGSRAKQREESFLLPHDLRFAGAPGAAQGSDSQLAAYNDARTTEVVARGVAGNVAFGVEGKSDRMIIERVFAGQRRHLPGTAGQGDGGLALCFFLRLASPATENNHGKTGGEE